MRLILAHGDDMSARALAARWGGDTLLLTPADLCASRWCLELDSAGRVRTELADETGKPRKLSGVVTRLGGITPADLPRVHPEDRRYAACELTAFLTAWLEACPVPVLNRPTASCLNGPAWQPEAWTAAAISVGLRVAGDRRRLTLGSDQTPPPPEWPDAIVVRVVGERCFGAVHPDVADRLRALARLAGIPLLGATVAGPEPDARVRYLSAWPDLTDPEVADAVGALLPVRLLPVATRPCCGMWG